MDFIRTARLLVLPLFLLLSLPAAAAGNPDPTQEFDEWLIPHVDRLIDRDDVLGFDDRDGHHDVGWIPEERMFFPDGGTGPWPSASVLYTLGRENPEYERIANRIVQRELELVGRLIAQWLPKNRGGDVAKALSNWKPGKVSAEKLVRSVPANTLQALAEGFTDLADDPQGYELLYEAGIGLPALIEGAKHFSGANAALVRLECQVAFETIASATSLMVLAYAYVPSLGGMDALNDLIIGLARMPAEGILSQFAKFNFTYGRSLRQPLYQALGAAIVEPLQQWSWSEEEQRYAADEWWSLPQLLEAVGYAYAYSKKAVLKDRATAGFNYLTNNRGWTELYEIVDGESVSIGGTYAPWFDPWTPDDPTDDYLNPYLSTVWLYQAASIKWYEVLRGSRDSADRARADLHLNRSVAIFRFLQRFMVNPENLVMDHDLRVYVLQGPDGPIYEVRNRNRVWYPIGCMQCNFAVIRNYLALNKLLKPFGR